MIQLLNGDCLSHLLDIKPNSVDFVLCDPPYGTTRQKWDNVIDFSLLWDRLSLVCKETAVICIFASPPFDKYLALSNISQYKYDLVWEKGRATGHLNAKKQPLRAHEYVCVFYSGKATYNPIKSYGHKPVNSFYTRGSGGIFGAADKSKSGGGNTDRYPRSVLKFNAVSNTDRLHPNQKPVDLLEYLICTYSNPGETVLDFAMGSGSAGMAALSTGRCFVGIEKDSAIFQTAKDRLNFWSKK